MIAHNNQFVKKETKQKYSKNWPNDVKDGLNYRGMHFSKQPFSRVAFPEQLLFDAFSGTTN